MKVEYLEWEEETIIEEDLVESLLELLEFKDDVSDIYQEDFQDEEDEFLIPTTERIIISFPYVDDISNIPTELTGTSTINDILEIRFELFSLDENEKTATYDINY